MTDTPAERGPENPWERLRRRKVVQWGLVYVAASWGFLQGLSYLSGTYDWPRQIQQLTTLALLIGLPVVLVLAYYHGDRSQRRITTPEFGILMLLLLLGGGAFWYYQRASENEKDAAVAEKTAQPPASPAVSDPRPSIAVLPFENRSREADDAFFVDGIHDDVLTQLTKVGALKVIARTSVGQFRDTNLTTREIGEKLGVTKVLEGSVQRAGDRVRVTVQLIDANSDAHVWAESYDRELTAANIFSIQSEVASAISGALKAALTSAEQARVDAIPTQNLPAWESYQLGKQRMAKRTSTSLVEAAAFFNTAIELDPKFALAYVGLSDALSLQTIYGGAPRDTTLTKAETAAEKALQLDPNLAEAWTSSAGLAADRTHYDLAEQRYRKAIELNPNYATAYHWLSYMLAGLGRMDEALGYAEKAQALDPLSAIINLHLGGMLTGLGRFSDADARYRKVIAIDPASHRGYVSIGSLNAYALNRFVDAAPFLRKGIELEPGDITGTVLLTWLLLDLGDVTQASRIADELQRRWPDDAYANSLSAVVKMFEGNSQAAVNYAHKSLELDPRQAGRWSRGLTVLTSAYFERHNYAAARARYAEARPDLLGPEPPINRLNYFYAINLAAILQKTGEGERAKMFLDQSEWVIRAMAVRLGEYGYGIADVRVEALRGDGKTALTALRQAEKVGWRGPLWRYYRDFDPALASIRNDPEFKAVFADIERDMARQRAALAKRPKDAPLDLAATGT